ncbi:MAG: thioredoxin family protein [Planctomycetes bacterium]|nr:thioredoxin family protein [Planctomycetota bacterium]
MHRPPLAALLALVVLLVSSVAAPVAAQKGGGFDLGPPGGLGGFDQHAHAELFSRVVGERVEVALRIAIDDGWHLYHDDLGNPDAIGKPTQIWLTAENVTFGKPRFPKPLKLDQEGLGTWIYGHAGEMLIYAAGFVDPGTQPGVVEARLDGLTCEDLGTCVPYEEKVTSRGAGDDALFAAFPTELLEAGPAGTQDATSGGASDANAPSAVPERPDEAWDAVTFPDFAPRAEQAQHGLLVWLLLAFLAGMILNVMPCVLPVISIKVLSFVQQAGEDKKRVLHLGLAFAAGIVTVFLVLATLAAVIGLSWGQQFQSQAFLVTMVGLVFAFALSLFGVFELGVPVAVGQLAGGYREGLGDAFAKGALATILATPCSGPFLGSTLTWTLAQPAFTIYAIFLCLGLGMALPYVVLTANPKLLELVPKPGPWMDTFKQAMGFVLMATVIYLLISVRQDLLLFTTTFLLFVALGAWWWGRFATWDKPKPKRLAHLAVALLLVAGGARLAFVEFKGLFEAGDDDWQAFDPDVFRQALDDGRSVFVDFTADWCPNCKYNEKWVYDDARVRSAFEQKDVLRLRADITHADAYTRMLGRLQRQLGSVSIPFMALFPSDAPSEPHVRPDIVFKDDLLGLLDALP